MTEQEKRQTERRKTPAVTREQMEVLISKGLVSRLMGERYLELIEFRRKGDRRKTETNYLEQARRVAAQYLNPLSRRSE